MLLHQLRLERSGSIPRSIQLKWASSTLDRLAGLAIFTVRGDILGQMRIQLAFQGCLSKFLDQRGQNAILPRDGLA